MANFSEFFIKSKGKPIQYKGKTIQLVDYFPVSNNDILIITFESTKSKKIQGVSIDVTGKCELEGELFDKGKGVDMIFWEDTAPKSLELKIFTKNKFVRVQNIWENLSLLGNRYVNNGYFGAAMIVEEIENGRRYRCNDWEPDEDFDDIIFTVQKKVIKD